MSSPRNLTPTTSSTISTIVPTETEMDKLLSSPIWPLGSVFLSLINARQSFCTSLRSTNTTTTTTTTTHQPICPIITTNLDGSPISSNHAIRPSPSDPMDWGLDESDPEQDRHLEDLLTSPARPQRRTTNKAPSLSHRLTSPPSTSRARHPHPPFHFNKTNYLSSTPSQPLSYNKVSSSTLRPFPHLVNRLDPAPEPFGTSTNRQECKNGSFRSWGPITHKPPRSHHTSHHHHQQLPDSSDPSRRASVHDEPDYHSNLHSPSPPQEAKYTNQSNDLRGSETKSRGRWEPAYDDNIRDTHFQKKKKFKQKAMDLNWSFWTNAADHQPKDGQLGTKYPSPQHSDSGRNRSPSASVGASFGATKWKRKGNQISRNKPNDAKASPLIAAHHPGSRHKRQKMGFELDHHDVQTRGRTTRSISPAFSSSQVGSISSRRPTESDEDYFRLSPLHPALEASIKRAVYSWVNQTLVESFWKIGIWFEDSKKWKSDQWGFIKLDQLAKIVDFNHPGGLDSLLKAVKVKRFIDLTVKPVHSGIFLFHRDVQSNIEYLKLTKDFTPIGLLYRPIIKALRRFIAGTGKKRINVEEFVRGHLIMGSDEEDLIYLFQDDNNPYGCIERAARDGIIEIFDDNHNAQNSEQATHHHPSSHVNNKRKRVPFEDKFISLKVYWSYNKEPTGLPTGHSPTISQAGSSAMLQTEEKFNPTTKAGARSRGGHPGESEFNSSNNRKKEESESCSKTSSTNTDDSDPIEILNPHQLRQMSPNQMSAFKQAVRSTHPINDMPIGRPFPSHQRNFDPGFVPNNDEAIIDSIILQLKKDVGPSY